MTLDAFRRHALKAAAAAMIAAGLAPAAFAQTTKLRVSTIPIIDTAPLQVAMAKGFFAAEGLEIDTTPTAGGAVGLPALAAGHVQVAFSNTVSTVLGAKQGLGFQIIAAGSHMGGMKPDIGGLIAAKGGPRTGKELEGKRFAVNTRNNIGWMYAREWVRATGGDPDKVTYVEVPFPQMPDAVRGNRAEVAFVMDPFLSAAVASGMEVVGWPADAVKERVPLGQYVATRSYIQQNPAVIDKFVRAYNKGVDWSNANKGSDEWVKIVSGYTRIPADKVKALHVPPFDKAVDPAAVEVIVNVMRRNALIDGPFDVKSVIYRTATAAR